MRTTRATGDLLSGEVLDRPLDCAACPLNPLAQGFSKLEGSCANGVAAIAEALGEHEATDGLPLRPQAPAGSVFDRTLRRAGIPREALGITNVVRCRPPLNRLEGAWYEFDAINHCKVHMDRAMETWHPKVIVALGNVALRTLTGYTGDRMQITSVRGFYLDGLRYQGIPVIGTYHPSYVQRDKPNLLGVMRLDLLRAVALAQRGGKFERRHCTVSEFATLDQLTGFLLQTHLHPDYYVTYDIETVSSVDVDEGDLKVEGGRVLITEYLSQGLADSPDVLMGEPDMEHASQVDSRQLSAREAEITQIQFTLASPDGRIVLATVVLPWTYEFVPYIVQIMRTKNTKMDWNGDHFDDPVLRMHGLSLDENGTNGAVRHDLMWAWHHLQPDLPRGLQYVCSFYLPEVEPWKHRAQSDPQHYGACDVEYPAQFGPVLLQRLKDNGVWRGYERHVLGMRGPLMRTSRRGVPVDEVQRLALGKQLDESKTEVLTQMQTLIPDEIRRCEPAMGYVRDSDAERKQQTTTLEPHERWARRRFLVGGSEDLEGTITGGERVERWCRLQPFLPTSSKQMLDYIRWHREQEVRERMEKRGQDRATAERLAKWTVPKNFKTGKDTSGKVELERLRKKTGDEVLRLGVEYREFTKLKSTYVDGWAPGEDGRVHTTFGNWPATGQLSSRAPNAQNAPKG